MACDANNNTVKTNNELKYDFVMFIRPPFEHFHYRPLGHFWIIDSLDHPITIIYNPKKSLLVNQATTPHYQSPSTSRFYSASASQYPLNSPLD